MKVKVVSSLALSECVHNFGINFTSDDCIDLDIDFLIRTDVLFAFNRAMLGSLNENCKNQRATCFACNLWAMQCRRAILTFNIIAQSM